MKEAVLMWVLATFMWTIALAAATILIFHLL